MDVDFVDLGGGDGDDRPGNGATRDLGIEALALERRNRLGVGESRNVAVRIENDDAGRDGTGETAPPHFVTTGDTIEPPTPDGVLEGSHRAHANHVGTRKLG